MQETWVRSLGQEDPLEKEMATHFSILAWRIPCTEEPGRLQSMGSQRVGHDWVTSLIFSSILTVFFFFPLALSFSKLSCFFRLCFSFSSGLLFEMLIPLWLSPFFSIEPWLYHLAISHSQRASSELGLVFIAYFTDGRMILLIFIKVFHT